MTDKLPALKPKRLVRALLKAGFYIYHQSGSHIQLRHYQKSHLRLTIAYHNRFEISPVVILNILKKAELSKEEFLKYL